MTTPRLVFITGGVVSSLGKGVAAAALGALLQSRGLRVRLRKLDPYINIDPGTMNPLEHGECFVTEDGAETDLDLGHYERFTGVEARESDNITTGKIYQSVIARERRGDYLGATVQVIPHVTDTIKAFILDGLEDEEFLLCEIGGTVGDIESLPFLEAIRQLRNELGRERTCFLHVTLLPWIEASGELKTKPTQHAVKALLSLGIQPDVLLCRVGRHAFPEAERKKIARFCNVPEPSVIAAADAQTIYDVPADYHARGLDEAVLNYFGHRQHIPVNLHPWEKITAVLKAPESVVHVALVGKYTALPDAYKSLIEALDHGGIANKARVQIHWISSENLEHGEHDDMLRTCNGILVPGGFGERGHHGKINAVRYAREHDVPFLGICFGMQLAVVEFAAHCANIEGAGSTEFGPCKTPVVGLLQEWTHNNTTVVYDQHGDMGGTMRLGSYPCQVQEDTLAHKIYGQTLIHERHRHRYEINIGYGAQLATAGMVISGLSPDGTLPEIIELPGHSWFLGVQFHPELRSRPLAPHPIFVAFIEAILKKERML